ncbi:hypothetical protein M436DRAFT_82114 [Aureobasidium namibiae CBS 147.97]|uniref:Uncharacterized protein n=1 Tax=Aureobasidium namibiae CBS 147.97 TaxID=1043004 RepID=A0A074WI77_9PEZI|nr:uncharacterized protein M436DRAFT_82114 [Aureobasidium namibiae CBS 147.97]KEQ72835.1 hypothetical protein M436DRAFT_82114 [Aureobasidium namibiae CBS 147.97]
MSKRSEPDDPTELPPTEASKKPRLDIQEQLKRASTLTAQLRHGVEDGTDSKTSAANQIATEELTRIFESMQKKTVDTSKSVDDLISAQIKHEVKHIMGQLWCSVSKHTPSIDAQINKILKPADQSYKEHIAQKVQEKTEGVTSGDYVAMIKAAVKAVLVEEYKESSGAELSAKLDQLQ